MPRTTLQDWLSEQRTAIDAELDRLVPPEDAEPANLHGAMRYSLFAGGKRLRPVLALAAARGCGGDPAVALPAACALEMVHTYSLIHDDLPAMDDDDLRRGRPTCHKRWGEGLAILAGDALLTLAFEVLAHPRGGDQLAAQLVREVAEGAGAAGMVGGQVADLEHEGGVATADLVEAIHRRKTGALITVSVRVGGLAVGADRAEIDALTRYGRAAGLAFQIADDILDETSDAATMGKATGKDRAQGKLTYPGAVGLDAARARARALAAEACDAVAGLPLPDRLTELARHLVERGS